MAAGTHFSTTKIAGIVLFTFSSLVGFPAGAQTHNYSEALQKALFFYEAQTSGVTPLNHRVEWRGDSCTRDGADVGLDLSGGWYDAGDGVVWTGNDAFGATLLAWSLYRHQTVYAQTGQYQIAIDRIREISQFFEKLVQRDSGGNILRLYCGKGAIRHSPPNDPAPDNDRTEGCPNEVMDTVVGGAPQALRPSYWVDNTTGGADVAGALAAALAANSIVLRQAGDTAYADQLLTLAKSVFAWGEANPNQNLVIDGAATLRATRRMTHGVAVTLPDYPGRIAVWTPRMIYAAAWLHRADIAAGTPGYTNSWVTKALSLYNSPQNETRRHRHWMNFATGTEHNGAYAMLAADTGLASFVNETNAYANFWLYDRSNHTGRTTDPTVTPDGFIARGQGAAWNVNAFLDQAPPLLDWADSSYNPNSVQKSRLIALYTGTYNAGNNECPVKQIDYILGSNSRKLSYLAGYKPAGTGYDWARNLLYRATNWDYGGFGTPTSDKTAWNRHIPYGTVVPGPDHTDYYPSDVPLTSGYVLGYQEPIIYSGGILTVLARNIAMGGPSAGQPLSTFPEWEPRPADYQTRSFFVRARRDSATRLQCFLNNRATLPPREINTLGFRYYFTPDGVSGSQVSCTATGLGLLAGESVEVSGPFQVGTSNIWYFNIRLVNAAIVPGEFNRFQRRVQLDFSQPSGTFSMDNDHSGAAVSSTLATAANIPVYDTAGGIWRLLGGFEPSPGYIQWRRAHFNNVLESAPSVVLIAERVGGSQGAVSATVSLTPGTAGPSDYTTPGNLTLSWGAGETGEKTLAIPLVNDSWDEGREYFTATLGGFTGGAQAGLRTTARVSIEDDDWGGPKETGSLVQVLGNNIVIAPNDMVPELADHTDFGSATVNATASSVNRTFTIRNLSSNTTLSLTGSPRVQLSGAHPADFTVTAQPPASVPPGGSATFTVRFLPSAAGNRNATITIPWSLASSGNYVFAVRGSGAAAAGSAAIVLDEVVIVNTTAYTVSQPFTIRNNGDGVLSWNATIPTNYIAVTSTTPGGPVYDWIDITTPGPNQGTVITSWGPSSTNRDDALSGNITLDFPFVFYGSSRSSLRISTNGWLCFTGAVNQSEPANTALPASSGALVNQPFLAVWWDDLYLKANQSDVYYKRVDADTFVVTWHQVSYQANLSANISFQAILKRDGRIIYQYRNVAAPPDANGYTIGIQNASSSSQAVQFAYNTRTAENGIAVEFRPPATGAYDPAGSAGNPLSLSSYGGNVGARGNQTLSIYFDPTGLLSGQSYLTYFTIQTSDPANPLYQIPVRLVISRDFRLEAIDATNRPWEQTATWSPSFTVPGPNDNLILDGMKPGGGSLRIDGPRFLNTANFTSPNGLSFVGTTTSGSGSNATLRFSGLVSIGNGNITAGAASARLHFQGGLLITGGRLGYAPGSTGAITVPDHAPITLGNGTLDTLVQTGSTIYAMSLGSGAFTLTGNGAIHVATDIYTLTRRPTGAGGFRKTGDGILVLTAEGADHTGTLEIVGGTVRLGNNDVLSPDARVRLSGGTLHTNGKTAFAGPLQLAANSTMSFVGGGGLLFADSSGETWGNATLSIVNFDPATSVLRFGTSSSALTPSQMSKIFVNGQPVTSANITPDGYYTPEPVLWALGWPKADTPAPDGFTVRAKLTAAGKAYWVILADGSASPSSLQVKNGQNASGLPAIQFGQFNLVAHVEQSSARSGLAPNTAYDVWFVAEDGEGNLQSAPVKMDISTLAPAASVFTWSHDGTASWHEPARWSPSGVPNGDAVTAVMGPVITAPRVVMINSSVTVGNMTFQEDTVGSNAYTLSLGSGVSLIFASSNGSAVIHARGSGGYAVGTPSNTSQIHLSSNLTIWAGSAAAATSEAGTVALSSRITGNGSLILNSLNSNDGSGTAPNGARGTFLRSTTANTFTGGVIVQSGYLGLGGHIGNAGSGNITLHASDSSNGGLGTSLILQTGGGTLATPIHFASPNATGGGNPRLAIQLRDGTTQTYTLTGGFFGSLGNQTLRIQSFSQGSVNTNSTLTLSANSSTLTVGPSAVVQLRNGRLILNHPHAFGPNNMVGSGTSGGWQIGNFSNNATGVAALLTNGWNVGGRILTNSATGAGHTSNDTLIVGGLHNAGSATFSGNIQLGRVAGGTRQFHLTSAAGGVTHFNGVISDGAPSGSAVHAVPVVKTGEGTVVLAGANTFNGTLTVSEGTLLVNNAAGSGTGTGNLTVLAGARLGGTGSISGNVTIQPGGALAFDLITPPAGHDRLDVGGTLALGSAVIDLSSSNSAAVSGTYLLVQAGGIVGVPGAVVPPPGFQASASVSGGQLSVTLSPLLTPLEQWRQTHFGSPSNSGSAADGADPDGDGVPNLVEFALGTIPTDPSSRGLPEASVVVVSGQNRLALTFLPQVVSGLSYVVQASNDLVNWTDQMDVTDQLTPGQPFTFIDSANLNSTPRRFLRLKIESSP